MKVYDCFLLNDEIELLDIRLNLLSNVVDRFVIVQSKKTFTDLDKNILIDENHPIIRPFRDKIRLINLESLLGASAWEKEEFSRNSISAGISDADPDDYIIVSDIDEIPSPTIIEDLKIILRSSPVVLILDYFNFKFNYQLIYGLDSYWAGPVVTRFNDFKSAQLLRNMRWILFSNNANYILNAGWHFSYLTSKDDVSNKLVSFSHQESEIQGRNDSISKMIINRQGFHDHLYPGSVWAIIDLNKLNSSKLVSLIIKYDSFISDTPADSLDVIEYKARTQVRSSLFNEQYKLLKFVPTLMLLHTLKYRVHRKIAELFYKVSH